MDAPGVFLRKSEPMRPNHLKLFACLLCSATLHAGLTLPWGPDTAQPPSGQKNIHVVLLDSDTQFPSTETRETKPPKQITARPPASRKPTAKPRAPQKTVPVPAPVATEPKRAIQQQCLGTQTATSSSTATPLLAMSGPTASENSSENTDAKSTGNSRRVIEAQQPEDRHVAPAHGKNPPPDYPEFALRSRQEGTVWIRAKVNAAGEAKEVSLEKTSGHRILDAAALKAARWWQFTPAMKNGEPVSSEVVFPVRYEIHKGT